jgi:hypothetical protein
MASAVDFSKAIWLGFDHVEELLVKSAHELLDADRANCRGSFRKKGIFRCRPVWPSCSGITTMAVPLPTQLIRDYGGMFHFLAANWCGPIRERTSLQSFPRYNPNGDQRSWLSALARQTKGGKNCILLGRLPPDSTESSAVS